MTTTTHALNEAAIGTIVGPADGYITRFELVTSQWPVWQADGWNVQPYPQGSFAGGGRLILRDGDGQGSRLLSFNPSYGGPSPYMLNTSVRYLGGLMLESCPKGAEYRLEISDTPVVRQIRGLPDMLFEYDLDDTMIGQTLLPANGYLVSLSKASNASARKYVVADWNEAEQRWQSAYLQLRATGDARDMVCVNPAQAPAFPGHITNKSIAYRGDFVIKCVPDQTSWRLVLSDAPLTAKELAEMAREQERKALEKSSIQMRADFERKDQPALIER